MNFKNLSKKEKIELLNKAKDAYYNSGEELLSDAEYDALEKEIGLENKSYIGSKAGNYSIKHSFIMGSLSKVQIKENKDGEINWVESASTISDFLNKANDAKYIETTPKLDGCSFSAEFKNVNGHAYLETIATRGNGEYGTDIKHWFKPCLKTDYWSKIDEAVADLCNKNSDDILCIRGEVLISQSIFSKKYADAYTNPRAFTAGMLGIKFEDADEIKLAQGHDLHFVCYDYRIIKNGKFKELSWMNPNDLTYNMLKPYLNHIGELPNKAYCQVHNFNGTITTNALQDIYNDYEDYRENKAEYALDGIVFKPECSARKYNTDRVRPVDCIAMKFMPMINITEIIDIEWNVKKTGELFPKAIVNPIKMPDGKTISKASLHNYGWIIKNNCGIGSKVRVSLAGDIIPFIYEIVEASGCDELNLPEESYIKVDDNSGALHLMKKMSDVEEEKNSFLSSADVLNINTIGPAAAEELYDNLHDEIPNLTNIIYLMNRKAYEMIYDKLGTGKSVQNIVNNLKQYAAYITITDIIKSFCFKLCGERASEICARLMSGLPANTSSIPAIAYEWAQNKSSKEYYMVKKAMEDLDVDFIEEESDNSERTPIIMTGSPEAFGYNTKAKFLQAHPEYYEVTSFKECKILFTDDLNSNSGKMQKAKKAGIKIKTYGDVKINENSSNSYESLF